MGAHRRTAAYARACALGALATVLVAGCGDGGSGETTGSARETFQRKCGLCHTLEDAGTQGTLGPNLDDLGFDRDRVRRQIDRGGERMPADLLQGEQADLVAEYVEQATRE